MSFSGFWQLENPQTIRHLSTDSPECDIGLGPTSLGYPYDTRTRRWKISYLPGGLRYASRDVEELHDSFVIKADDLNAGGFAERCAGGGGRDGVYGNK